MAGDPPPLAPSAVNKGALARAWDVQGTRDMANKIYSPGGVVMADTAQYAEVYTRGAVFGQCARCGGAGHRAHDVAPWVAPVAPIAPGLAPAEVDVCCDACGGSGMTRVLR